ncbi:hypothetical protein IWW48_000848 [Coemansia sp. RSA 1200]|nr:hypothetical protein IWW48_000848 [Coemansia sp. RSA 1200]
MIEEKPLHGNDGANDSGTSKKPRRRRRDPKAPLQDAGPGRHATTSGGNGGGSGGSNNKGYAGREKRVPGSGGIRFERGGKKAMATQSKAEEESEGPLDEGKEKPSTKVCIRWLPADLPEHIFWKSVEPALPWFDPEHVGSVTQREREVLCAVTEENDNENDDEFDRSAIEAGAGAAGEPQIAEKESNDEPPSLLLALAETKMAMVDVYESNNLAKLDSQPYWRQYSQGKRHRSKAKPDDPSRAYILFAEAAEADHFYRHFHGHAFGKNGVINRAVVELAPFQHVFWTLPTAAFAASDPLDDTLDADPHFIAFLKSEASKGKTGNDNAPSGGSASSSAPPPVTALAEPQTARISYAAAAASLGKDSGSSGTQGSGSGSRKENKAVTPLIEYLRRIKTTGTARRPPPTQAAKTAAASPARPLSSTKASAVNNKAGGKKGASKSTAASAAPKRPRRRKQ